MKHNCEIKKTDITTRKSEKVTLIVVIITLITMVAEIIAGLVSGSMALLSDGVHMGTHAIALFITLAVYIFARKQFNNPSFSFGTGKVGVLGGYTNAVLLLLAAGAMAVESVERLINPVDILLNQAIIVAVIGLVVNIASAAILGYGREDHVYGDHIHSPKDRGHHRQKEDHNLKSAYLHVITDALTSVLAIFALLIAKFYGLFFVDPAVGVLGSVVIAKWAIGLLRQTSSLLLDKSDTTQEIASLRSLIESDSTQINDIHIWQISENERFLILSLTSSDGRGPEYYHRLARQISHYEHITVEIIPP